MKQRWGIIVFCFLGALSLGMVPSQAAALDTVLAETSGFDNFTGPDYYGVHYVEGTSFIQSVTFDISGDPDGFFDFDGADNFGNATEPVLSGITVGLTSGDITYAFSNFVGDDHPQILIVNFAPGAFAPGDILHFAAETDLYRQDPAPGGVFGLPGSGRAIFSAVLESGQSGSAPFIELFDYTSAAPVAFCPCPAPLPTALLLLGSGLLGVWGIGRMRS